MLNRLAKSEDIQRTLPCRQQTIDLDSGHLWAHSHLGPGKKDQLRVQGSGMSKMPHRYLILSRTSRLTWPSASMNKPLLKPAQDLVLHWTLLEIYRQMLFHQLSPDEENTFHYSIY
ncbi:Hypothetical predicted protein [Mytilus galloprovincialis]|uniref:Uncharacterized protein n=1 Tax=Mytilus galloprovincialis TaxID=29158 RepID=A0A8B6F3U6_MYTGA|nr:Hypothetical predicted protein [Mytilus galloprovincialis]